MASHTVSESAKLAGVTRRTIYRHIKAGRLSVMVTEGDNTLIETSELLRVYGALTQPEPESVSTGSLQLQPEYVTHLLSELSQLRGQVESLTNKVDDLKEKLALPPPTQEKLSFTGWMKQRWGKKGK